MTTPRTSVVVPSRGGATRLPVLLGALAGQTDLDLEVVVVLDGDVDGSEAAVAGFVADHPELTVRAVVLPENRGRSAALNVGFATARGDVLVRCDDDLEPAADYVERHAAAHAAGAVGVVGLYLNATPDTPYTRAYGRTADLRFRDEAYAAPETGRWRYWAGNASVDRATWQRVGPYDEETFRAYGWEDVDWGYRLHRAGVPVVLDPALETVHRAAADTTERRLQRAWYSGAARARFDVKHPEAFDRRAPTPGAKQRVWSGAVSMVSHGLDENRVALAGRAVDRLLPRAPERAGTRMVGLLIEAAFDAGHRRPTDVGSAI